MTQAVVGSIECNPTMLGSEVRQSSLPTMVYNFRRRNTISSCPTALALNETLKTFPSIS